MPEISRFLGVIVSMYFDEHNPPHFHVRYNEYRAVVSIKDRSSKSRPPARKAARGSLPQAAHGATRAGRGRQLWESKEFHKIEPLA